MTSKKYSKDSLRSYLQLRLAIWLEKHSHTKRKFTIIDVWFVILLSINILSLLFTVSEISISFKESEKLLFPSSLLFWWIDFVTEIFGANDYSLRGSCIAIHCCNVILLYMIGRLYLKKPSDSLFLVAIYMLLPGINFSAILLYESGFIIFMLLLICYIHLRYKRIPYILIFAGGLLNLALSVLFIALGIYAIRHKKTKTFIACIVGFGINMFAYSSDIGGTPSAHFLDALGELAMLFSPFLFLYYIYALYAGVARRKDDTLMIYISVSGLILTLLLSFRQEINIMNFAPLCVVGLPIMVFDFFNNMRVRLKIYRLKFKVRIFIICGVLCLETFMIFGNKLTYLFSPKPNFASNYYIAKDLAHILLSSNINGIKIQDHKLALRLNFYGINAGNTYCLYSDTKHQTKHKGETITIKYLGVVVARYTLVKNNACRI